MKYYVHNYINFLGNNELELYHKTFFYKGKSKRVSKTGRSKTSYFKNYSLSDKNEELKVYFHAIDWSLDKIFMDTFNRKGEKNKLGKKNIIFTSTDQINFFLGNKEAVEILNNWNNKKYRCEDNLVNREFFKVVRTINKIRRRKKIGISFEYIADSKNEAANLVSRYDFLYNRRVLLKRKERISITDERKQELENKKFRLTNEQLKNFDFLKI